MRSFLLLLVGLMFCLPRVAWGRDTSRLLRITGEENIDSTRLVLGLSSLPTFRAQATNQRVDLILSGTTVAPSFQSLPQAKEIVKVLLGKKGKDLIVSLLLRQSPGRVMTTVLHHPARIVLDLLWQSSATRPDIALRLGGMPMPKQGRVVATVPPKSAYSGDWQRFFRDYRTPMKLKVPLHYTLPSLPLESLLGRGRHWPSKISPLVRAGKWTQVLASKVIPAGQPGGKPPVAPVLEVLRSEALLRTGSPKKALVGLDRELASASGGAVATWAGYLKSYLLAEGGKPYRTRVLLQEIRKAAARTPFRPYLRFLRAETDLAIGENQRALGLLAKPSSWPHRLRGFVALRRADALAASGRLRLAAAAYRKVKHFPRALMDRPFSLWQAGRSFTEIGDNRLAAWLFESLAKRLPPSPQQGEVRFAWAQASFAAGDRKVAEDCWSKLKETYSKQEVGCRAWLKLLDQKALTGKKAGYLEAAAGYGRIAGAAPLKGLREEAAFKAALALCFAGQKEKSVQLLQTFLRDCWAGPLYPDAEVLLSQLLPGVVGNLIARGEELRAAALVERNRRLLPYRRMTRAFLLGLGQAYGRLGLFDRAEKVYRYLLDEAGAKGRPGKPYLLLTRLYYRQGDDARVLKLVDHYLARFPRGKDRLSLIALQVRALRRQGRLKEAAARLSALERPLTPDLEELALRIYTTLGRYGQVAELSPGEGNASRPGPASLLLMAEAFYKLGKKDRALTLYERLVGFPDYADQARYREAQIYLAAGKREEALKDLQILVEKGKSPLWRKLAGETLKDETLN